MDQTDKDVANLKRYLRERGFKLGNGRIMDVVMKVIARGDAEDLRLLNKVMADPRQAAALMGLAVDDLTNASTTRRAAPRKRMRRGIGSY